MGVNRSLRSWTVNSSLDSPSPETTWFKKFRLLLWKNYKIQIRHKVQTVTEIFLPLLFTAVLVIVRNIVPSKFVNEPTIYKPLILENSPPGVIQTKCDRIYFTPNNPIVDALMQKVNEQYFNSQGLQYNFTGFDTEQDLVNAYIKAASEQIIHSSADFDSTAPVLAGVVFTNEFINGTFPTKIEYKLRFPATQRSSFDIISERFGIKPAWFTEIIYPLFQLLGPRSKDHPGGGLPGYNEEGFLYLQYAIDRSLTREFLNSTQLENYNKYDIKLQRFPYPAYIDDKFLFALQGWLPLIIMLSFIYPVINITKSVVYEKEKRLKEYMKMMGLPNWLHWLAWFTKSYLFLLISVGLMTLLLKMKFSPSQDLAVLPESDATLIFFIFLVFAFSLICFAFFVSTLFSHASAGATAAGVLWFVFYVPYGFLQPRYNLLSREMKLLSCFLVNTAIAFACQIICMFEGTGAGIQWNTIFQGSGPDDNFAMADCLLMMIVNGIFYLLSALYIEAIHPGEYGVPLPYYYPFTKWFWTGGHRVSHYDKNEKEYMEKPNVDNEFIETEPSNVTPGIQIKGLTKIYDNAKVAVKNLNINFFEGQITAFLGTNGAGKTTTLSILSGLFPPTSGTALINNFDISRDIHSARSSLGLCPQYDILFDELTVEEHFRFYCLMKGCKASYVEREINRMIKALGLESKRNSQSHTLSGGMKRKLSVGIAFCGGSKVVLLDECTSGMDVGARRSTWDLIKSEKKKRTILISTHFMEEADVLGDRIAIMANGEIQCCGSSLFLKKKYGGGYHLIIVKDPECNIKCITDILKKTIPDIEVDQDVGAELSYSLPEGKSHLFPQMFEELEQRKDELGIASYGASITTMEEVFIKVGREAEAKIITEHVEDNHSNKSLNLTIDSQEAVSDSKSKLYQDEPPRNKGIQLKFQQFRAMLTKKVLYASRNRMLLLAQMGIPILYLVLILVILSNLPGISNPPGHSLTLKRYEKLGRTITSIRCPDTEPVCRSYKEFVSKNYMIELVSLNETFIDYMLKKEKEDLVTVNFRYILGFDQRKANESDVISNELVGFFNNQPFHSPPLSLNFITNSLLSPTNHTIQMTNHPFPYSSIDTLKQVGSLYTVGFQIGYNIAFGMSFLAASFVVFLITERETRSKHIQFVSGLEFPMYWIASFIIDFIQYTIPCFGLMAVLLLFRIEEFLGFNMQLNLLLLLLCYGLAVIPLMYLWSFAFTVASSGFTRLVLFNIFTGMASMLTVVIIQIPELHLGHIADILNTILLIFPNYALGMGVVQLSTNYQLTRDCAKFNLEYICPAFPDSYCCAKLKANFLDWERVGIGRNITYLLCAFVIYFTILFIVESRILSKLFGNKKTKQVIADKSNEEEIRNATGLEDSEVLGEKQRIHKTNLSTLFKDNTLVVRDLTKYYGDFQAVDHINLGVQRGECFGLLGTNGAGKTSTFKMLTGDLPISEGDAYICSRSVGKDLKKVHEVLGYCPQYDCLIDELTGRETIRMYARLRGIKEVYIERLANRLGETLLFSQFIDKRVGGYSGGNKRKLSTAIALIGNPAIIFLDEMTTGMDPVARRHMWTAISKIRDSGTSIVLTSHSMNECEALCTRLAIMVNGTFRCLGSPQQLKNKFGEGYTLIAQITPKGLSETEPFTREKQELGRRRSSIMSLRRIRSPQRWESELEELRSYIEESFPECILKDIHPGFVHYQVPGKDVTWGQMFAKMEIAKEKFNLEAYSVGQCSLEQVFLAFSKAQLNVE